MIEFLRFTVFCITLLLLCMMGLTFIRDMKSDNKKKNEADKYIVDGEIIYSTEELEPKVTIKKKDEE